MPTPDNGSVDLKPSFIRTLVPFVVGPLAGWLANKGLNIDSVLLTMALSSVIGYLYYVVARFLEIYSSTKWGYILLGSGKAPVYVDTPATVVSKDETRVVTSPDDNSKQLPPPAVELDPGPIVDSNAPRATPVRRPRTPRQ